MMFQELERYDEYKYSGNEWIGDIPSNWNVFTLKELASNSKGSFVDGPFGSDLKSNEYTDTGIPLIQLNNIGIGFHSTKNLKYISEEKALILSKHKAYPGEIAIAKMAEPVARATVISNEFPMYVIVADCIKFKPNSRLLDNKFIAYALNTTGVKSQAEILSNGTTRIRINLGTTKILKVAIPPLQEQQAITSYLDTVTGKIDRKIDLLNKKVIRYNQLKNSLINETVTKGLDKTAAMKDSEVNWIGEVPKHWEVKRVKDLTQVKRGASPRPIDNPIYFDEKGEFSWVRIADLSASDRYLLTTKEKLSELGSSLSIKRYPGDLILSIAGTVGKPIITKIKCCIHDGFVWFPDLKINPEYWYYCFSTGLPYRGLGKLGTQLNLNTETVGLISLPLPPADELKAITKYLDTKTAQIDKIVKKINNQIEKLKELRNSLINDVVTGKIKVVEEGVKDERTALSR